MHKKNLYKDVHQLMNEIEQLTEESQQEYPTFYQLSLQTKDTELQLLVDSMNGLIDAMQTKYKNL